MSEASFTKERMATTASEAASRPQVTASHEAADSTRLQRHRSYHSQSKNNRRRLEKVQETHHRRATSVRVRPTFIEAEEDSNLPQPPVSIQVASPEDEDDLEVANTLGHRYNYKLTCIKLSKPASKNSGMGSKYLVFG